VGCERGVHYYAMQFIDGRTLAAVIAERRQQAGLDKGEPSEKPTKPDGERAVKRQPAAEQPGISGPPTTPYIPKPAAPATPAETLAQAGLSTECSLTSLAYVRSVAQLGVQAAEALEHAHQLDVVHRDIKPANLLVDVRGNLWITDFGLAQCQGRAGLTLMGERVGTPRYMSPEQALAKRGLLDHRTDLYSLGVTLYELLTLEPACDGTDWNEVMRQITLEEPRPPRRLNPAIPADLETIVLKALAKEPEGRYATAQEMAEDLRRFLEDKPIQARRATLWQRARKFGRRHPSVVVATIFILVVTVAALAVSNVTIRWEQDRTRRAEQDEREAKETAQKRLAQIEKGNEILASVFRNLDPRAEEKEGKSLRVLLGERLEEAVQQLEGQAVGDSAVVARIQLSLGNSLRELGHLVVTRRKVWSRKCDIKFGH
jgi:hypothetical protein